MSKRKKPVEKKTFYVPFRLTLDGTLFVEAESVEEAKAIADRGGWDDDTFCDRASHADWEVTGEVEETK